MYVIPVNIVFCSLGEIYDKAKNICEKCPAGKYNFEFQATNCYDCFSGGICMGGSEIKVKPGYWRSDYFSKNVYQCDEILQNCVGGVGPECSANYKGRLCEECGLDKDGNPTIKNVFGECLPCDFSQTNIWLNIFFTLFSLIAYLILLKVFLKEDLDFEYKSIFRLIINYFEDLYFYPIRNNPLSDKSDLFNWINRNLFGFSEKLFSYDCFDINFGVDGSASHSFPSAFNRLAFIMLFFTAFLVMHSVVWIILYRKKRLFKKELILNLSLLIYIFYPALSLQSIQPFKCINIDGFYYVESNLSSKCWNFQHLLGISILCAPNILIWTIILPIKVIMPDVQKKFGKVTTFFTHSNTRKSKSITKFEEILPIELLESKMALTKKINIFHSNSNIFYSGYRNEYFDWEKYVIGKKVSLVYCAGFFANEPKRLFFCLFIYFFYFFLVMRKKPHKSQYLNSLESCHCSLFIFSYFILIIVKVNQNFYYENPLVILFIIFHTAFLCFAFKKLIFKMSKTKILARVKANFKAKDNFCFGSIIEKLKKKKNCLC